METIKPFRKHDDRIITVTIDENGDALFLKTNVNDAFLDLGEVVTQRASHVEPYHFGYRVVFHILRWFGDKNRIAEWTRNWPVFWRINTKPVGGPILTWADIWKPEDEPWLEGLSQYRRTACFSIRQMAIDAEIKFLNKFFLERGIQ